MLNDSFSQKLRRQLNLPLQQKNFFFKLLLPILFLISFFIFLEAKRRRKKNYRKKTSVLNNEIDIKIICIGNILIGGTGKSPIVQEIAKLFLNNNYVVAIASRGIGSNIKSVNVDSKQQKFKDFLSDENREHFEKLMLHKNINKEFYILQNPNRAESLKYFSQQKLKESNSNKKYVFLLDDGLQHFQCPRDINICVWDPKLLLQSPLYVLPIGPYREGFGKNDFQNLLTNFDFRFWSRTSYQNLKNYSKTIKNCIKIFNLKENIQDIIVCSETIFYEISPGNSLKEIDSKAISILSNSYNNISVVTGIANPDRFLLDLKQFFPQKNFKHLSLGDHGNLSKNALDFINNSEFLIFTLKDYYRWCQHLDFAFAIKLKKTILCSIDVSFYNLNLEKEDFFTKLVEFKR
ncbi:tetraacyldisaccharide 4'-kinase [Pigmentibacter sp. JX0631]|uniref:tetraacyldisaccharide 4'-kinase n=1 Tax=Pigmentibacter sp. JX0631 TaxID=2976982 RepID=UPI002468DC1C|nr:tetraacyldisaccharide 4'-kinase [Pigmentibacter sp. JX0631]WGL61165.1 tetraacyldisaccharide 4'-kinase [Pigmentibacter sp. JX0631]